MRKLLILSVLLLTCATSFAQQPTIKSGNGEANYKIMDSTVVDAAAPSVIQPIIGNKSALTFFYNVTKNSGTVGGTIVLYGSCDGGTSYDVIQSYTVTDASQRKSYTYNWAGYGKYKVTVTGTGTMNANYKIWVLYRQ